MLAAKKVLDTPFIVINADDYYGKEGFKAVHEYLVNGGKSCMAGFVLKNTLSDNGGVTRGICKMDDQNNLTEVVETKNIVKTADGAEANGVVVDAGVRLKTYSGLPFTYEIRKGRNGQYTKELWIDRRENSKSLAWSSVLLALGNIKKVGEVVERPKALGDIRGVTYIYGMFYRFGLINVPDEAKEKMKKAFGKSF